MLQLRYFASLRDALECDQEQLDGTATIETVAALRDHLASRGGHWAEQLQSGRTLAAVNQEVATNDTPLKDGDEVAFFPPVTGG